jgi:hypothetical protein
MERETPVKEFVSVKMSILFLGIGAALFLAPACKAQSEISPDHFDGTDAWAVSSQTPHPSTHKQTSAKSQLQGHSQTATKGSAFQLAAAREVSKPSHPAALAVDRKRKPTPQNPEKK